MSEDQTDHPSQFETNKAVRVLNGTPLKFTIRVHKPDGIVIEWQAEKRPDVKWHDEARQLALKDGAYDYSVIMLWEPGFILLTEENPKP